MNKKNNFEDLLLMYKLGFSEEKIKEIGSFWEKYIDFNQISSRNFIASKYALALGEVVPFFAQKFPFVKREFREKIVESIKAEGKFDIETNGFAFQYFCYFLFKDYEALVLNDESKKDGKSSVDFYLMGRPEIGLEIKRVQGKNRAHERAEGISSVVSKLLAVSDFQGQFYINLIFDNQKVNDGMHSRVNKKIIDLVEILLAKLATGERLLLGEGCEKDDFNFCIIKIFYQPDKINFNDYRFGEDLAGEFIEGHNISKNGGGFCIALDYLKIDLESRINEWSEQKFKKTKGMILLDLAVPIYDKNVMKKIFFSLNRKNPNLIGLLHFGLWNENPNKFAVAMIYYNKKDYGEVQEIINELDRKKIDVEEYVVV